MEARSDSLLGPDGSVVREPGASGLPGVERAPGQRGGNPWRGALIYTVGVILFGAVVRITGSGAGCGQHWPTCQGEVAHLPRTLETAIEFTHRITSGLSMLLVFGLAVYTARRTTRTHVARRAALIACALMIFEALIGAALVLLRLVGHNDSLGRAVIMAVHLGNTLGLTGAMAIAAGSMSWKLSRIEWGGAAVRWVTVGALGITAVAAAGAVTALGDTLYPVTNGGAAGALAAAQDQSQHFLERVRGIHPLMALAVSGLLLGTASRIAAGALPSSRERAEGWARAVVTLVFVQLILGVANVWLSAPGWMQVVHLLAALLLWLAWVSLAFAVLGREDPPGQPVTAAS
jgi:heme A synthase